jgi:predicted transposase YdaD
LHFLRKTMVSTSFISREKLRQEVRRWIQSAREEGVREGRREGWREGVQSGAVEIILRWAKQQLGDISPPVRARIEMLSLTQLKELADVLPTFKSEQELDRWCDRYF